MVRISSHILYVMLIYSHNLNQIKPQDLLIMKYILNIDLLKNAIIQINILRFLNINKEIRYSCINPVTHSRNNFLYFISFSIFNVFIETVKENASLLP